ncbi:LysR family transcriptional regulator [Microbacterium sp. 1P10UB]|uniref:LysR family transcriptional regulator n=1 Tax=unclassified Microbacterium TaxID=2609290 RepID=UPI00399F38A5
MTMNTTQLARFVAAAEELHFPRAAEALGIPLASLYTTLDKLEAEVGHPLLTRDGGPTRLTPAGELLLVEARERLAAAPPPVAPPKTPGGGKAKASKGKGRAPVVKGQPKPFKKRQGR